jgi:hypothetical protein
VEIFLLGLIDRNSNERSRMAELSLQAPYIPQYAIQAQGQLYFHYFEILINCMELNPS